MCPPSAFASSDPSHTTPPLDLESIVPETPIGKSAFELASSLLAPAILNHSVRVYLYAKTLVANPSSIYHTHPAKHDLLFVACIFHDIGTTSTYNGPQRFEVEGGDAAVKHLDQHGVSKEDKHDVWVAIALHTSPHIAEKISELAAIVRKAILFDFGRSTEGTEKLVELREEFEGKFARANIERVLGDAVVGQAVEKPEKAPIVSWPGALYQAHLQEPEWDGVNKAFEP